MGILRFILAITVIIAHSQPLFGVLNLTDGVIAVQIFFMISGFYMGLILSEKYNKDWKTTKAFYYNRFIKIYPLYWFVLIGAVIIGFVELLFHDIDLPSSRFIQYFSNSNDYFHLFLLILPQITLIGLEWLLFLKYNSETKSLNSLFSRNQNTVGAHEFIYVPQAWTLGLEVLFYLFAPLLNKIKSRYLFIIIIFSLLFRIFAYYFLNLRSDPWVYRYFPFEISFFLVGILTYRGYIKFRSIIDNIPKKLIFSPVIFQLLLIILFQFIPLDYNLKKWALFVLTALNLPLLFNFSKKIKFDRGIGELSYPIYIVHNAILIYFWGLMYKFSNIDNSIVINFLSILVIIGVSIILNIILNKFLKRFKIRV